MANPVEGGNLPSSVSGWGTVVGGITLCYLTARAVVIDFGKKRSKELADAERLEKERAERERLEAKTKAENAERKADAVDAKAEANHKSIRRTRRKQSQLNDDQQRVNDELLRELRRANEGYKELLALMREDKAAMQKKFEELQAALAKAEQKANDFEKLYTDLSRSTIAERAEHARLSEKVDGLTKQNAAQAEELKALRTASDVKAYKQLFDDHRTLLTWCDGIVKRLAAYEPAVLEEKMPAATAAA